MSDIAIHVENLSKRYRIGLEEKTHDTLISAWTSYVRSPLKNLRNLRRLTRFTDDDSPDILWALKNVSFDVRRGEVVGIIGRNGAGKSTLLKILSRITLPSRGRVEIDGRVASLLEVGTGFHPELTGRENVYLNGTILGMTRVEIDRKFDEIVSFSGIEKFIDTPVKRYSSGMRVRLAFSVSAHLDPEVLLIDEVLAVGDAEFQQKCLGKMEEVGKKGRTVLFVSHNLAMVRSLCSRSIMFELGEIEYEGSTDKVITYYLSSAIPKDNQSEIQWQNQEEAPGGDEVKLLSVRLVGLNGEIQNAYEVDQPIRVEVIYEVKKTLHNMRVNMHIMTQDGVIAFASSDQNSRGNLKVNAGTYLSACTIPAQLLNRGKYLVKIHIGIPNVKVLVPGKEYLSFSVESGTSHGSNLPENWPGVVSPVLEWQVSRV